METLRELNILKAHFIVISKLNITEKKVHARVQRLGLNDDPSLCGKHVTLNITIK